MHPSEASRHNPALGHFDASRNIENLGLLVGQLAYGLRFGDRVTLCAYVA
jgi:hypothetical protein